MYQHCDYWPSRKRTLKIQALDKVIVCANAVVFDTSEHDNDMVLWNLHNAKENNVEIVIHAFQENIHHLLHLRTLYISQW